MSVWLLVVGILLFIGLVLVHEWGHFIVARRNGVEVEEFGLFFFPPRLFKYKTKAGWLFTINAVPMGGFVRLKGEHDTDTEPGSFGAASLWVKSKIMAAGVVMNLLTALVLLTILALVGMPKMIPNQFTVSGDTKLVSQQVLVGYVEPGSPAAKAGLRQEDELNGISLPGRSPVALNNADKLPSITKSFAGKTAIVYYTRSGQPHETKATLLTARAVAAGRKAGQQKGYLGVSPTQFTLQRSTWSAPVVAVGLSVQAAGLTYHGLGHALGGLGSLIAGAVTGNKAARENGQTSATAQVAGPVGVFAIMKSGSLLGVRFMLFFIAIVSLTLAVINILPVPALDGGRLWIMLITRGLKRPLSAGVEEAINLAGFVVLIGLVILISIVDVKRFF